ncbi:hypothetical protein CHU98_g8692 [Xylaria longipes]|nr:hypothetical protein CHU98_g8692 [Xylaria longipes]
MATPVIQGTIRTNLGPLTTATWTYTCTEVIQRCSSCDDGWAAQTCMTGVVTDNKECWPPTATDVPATSGALSGWGVYSPGIVCPGGYTSAAAATHGGSSDFQFQYPLTAGETALGCCPKGGFSPILDVNQLQTCVQFKPTASFLVGSCGTDGPAYTPFSVGGTLDSTPYNSFSVSAPFFQAVHKASDLPDKSAPTSTDTQSSSSSSNSPTPQPSGNSPAVDLSRRARRRASPSALFWGRYSLPLRGSVPGACGGGSDPPPSCRKAIFNLPSISRLRQVVVVVVVVSRRPGTPVAWALRRNIGGMIWWPLIIRTTLRSFRILPRLLNSGRRMMQGSEGG